MRSKVVFLGNWKNKNYHFSWILRLLFLHLHFWPHWTHSKGRIFSCTADTCLAKWSFLENLLWQSSHCQFRRFSFFIRLPPPLLPTILLLLFARIMPALFVKLEIPFCKLVMLRLPGAWINVGPAGLFKIWFPVPAIINWDWGVTAWAACWTAELANPELPGLQDRESGEKNSWNQNIPNNKK